MAEQTTRESIREALTRDPVDFSRADIPIGSGSWEFSARLANLQNIADDGSLNGIPFFASADFAERSSPASGNVWAVCVFHDGGWNTVTAFGPLAPDRPPYVVLQSGGETRLRSRALATIRAGISANDEDDVPAPIMEVVDERSPGFASSPMGAKS